MKVSILRGAIGLTVLAVGAAGQSGIKLLADDGLQGDQLGWSVDIDGDRLVLGARLEGHGGVFWAGAAYVFERSGSTWAQTAKLVASDGQVGDQLGSSVHVDGDTILVGAARADFGAQDAGSAYVFAFDGSTWSEQARLDASDADFQKTFGSDVALDGDTAIVGAPGDGPSSEGAAYVFVRSGTTWSQQAKLTEPVPTNHRSFGRRVALHGGTAVVSRGRQFDGLPGALHVYERSGTTWSHTAQLDVASDAHAFDLGRSLDFVGDHIVAGDFGDDHAGHNSGAVHVFLRSGSTWSHEARLTAADAAPDAEFGSAVGIDGPFLAVGAPLIHDGAIGGGGGYVFVRGPSGWTQQAKLIASDPDQGDFVGISAALSGSTVLFGSLDDENGIDAGAGYVFEAAADTTFTYCSGKTSGLGCVPFLSAYGTPSATGTQPFRVTAHDLTPNQASILLYGFAPANLSFHGAKLCVKAPVQRVLPPKTAKFSGPQPCPGIVTRNFNARIQSGVDPLLTVGASVRAQWFQRDPFDPAGFGDGLTNAVRFVIEP